MHEGWFSRSFESNSNDNEMATSCLNRRSGPIKTAPSEYRQEGNHAGSFLLMPVHVQVKGCRFFSYGFFSAPGESIEE